MCTLHLAICPWQDVHIQSKLLSCCVEIMGGWFFGVFAVGVNILLAAFAAGCHLHSEHTTDQCQCSGAGTARAESPSATAPGHEKLPGTSWPHSESLIAGHKVHRAGLAHSFVYSMF